MQTIVLFLVFPFFGAFTSYTPLFLFSGNTRMQNLRAVIVSHLLDIEKRQFHHTFDENFTWIYSHQLVIVRWHASLAYKTTTSDRFHGQNQNLSYCEIYRICFFSVLMRCAVCTLDTFKEYPHPCRDIVFNTSSRLWLRIILLWLELAI